jgi:cyclase
MRIPLVALSVVGTIAMVAVVAAQPDKGMAKVSITSKSLADNVHMLEGAGGNMVLVVGKDGSLLIDDQFAPLTAKIVAAAKKLGG